MRERELGYLHSDSFSRRTFHLGRTFWPGRGVRRAVGRLYLAYFGAMAAFVVLFGILALVARLLGD